MPPALHGGARLGVRVLIVEDSPLVRKMYGLVFSKREHELTTAEDGRKALEVLTADPRSFDLILLDLRMPDMDGVEFIRAVRLAGRFRDIPIVLTTVEPDTSPLLREAVVQGVAAVVKKPWKPHELRAVVQSVLHEPRP
jgi:two-component system response regulator RpfG